MHAACCAMAQALRTGPHNVCLASHLQLRLCKSTRRVWNRAVQHDVVEAAAAWDAVPRGSTALKVGRRVREGEQGTSVCTAPAMLMGDFCVNSVWRPSFRIRKPERTSSHEQMQKFKMSHEHDVKALILVRTLIGDHLSQQLIWTDLCVPTMSLGHSGLISVLTVLLHLAAPSTPSTSFKVLITVAPEAGPRSWGAPPMAQSLDTAHQQQQQQQCALMLPGTPDGPSWMPLQTQVEPRAPPTPLRPLQGRYRWGEVGLRGLRQRVPPAAPPQAPPPSSTLTQPSPA